MSGSFKIGDREVGPGNPCYVIAEAGANHNRDWDVATQLIDVAVAAGADAVKFQTYSGDRIYSTKTPKFEYLKELTDDSPSELLEKIALPRDWQPRLAAYAAERDIDFFSTPFDHEAVTELAALGVPLMKIASFELVDLPLIEAVGRTGIPTILSTGMGSLGEIEEAIAAHQRSGASQLGLMQCTSTYPAPPEAINLRAMETMRAAFGVPVGLSDHTEGIAVPIAAAALEAAFIEKHFTLDRTMEGPDHPFAIEPDELRAMIAGIRETEVAMGSPDKHGPSPAEAKEMYQLARRSLIVVGGHPAGTALTAEMLTVKRPGYGIAPKHLDLVIGRPLKAAVEHDEILTWELV